MRYVKILENNIDLNNIVKTFLSTNEQGVKNMYDNFYPSKTPSIQDLNSKLENTLQDGCINFFNKNYEIDKLDSYLFYLTNDFYKKNVDVLPEKKVIYICPGCLVYERKEVLNKFQCTFCTSELKKTLDSEKFAFYKAFSTHSKNGYRCTDCNRFIPKPNNNSQEVSCPYLDCIFVGPASSLKKMYHPSITDNISIPLQEKLSNTSNSDLSLIKEVILSQRDSLNYNSSNFTLKHKVLVYNAFNNLLDLFPKEMSEYLSGSDKSKHNGFQHKVFQAYISLLENEIPFTYKKANKTYKVESLLDTNLFDGISKFESIVTDKHEIKNETKEFYIGGRKAAYSKPYYIGKLLSIVDMNNYSLMNNVTNYSFSRIKLTDVEPGAKVIVTHLRIPPHYQMGGMVYVNRIRKKIVDHVIDINKVTNGF